MNKKRVVYVALATIVMVANLYGHGTPLWIDVVDGRLAVSHQDSRFAPPIFAQPDEYDDYAEADVFPGLGNIVLWDSPGLDIFGMADNASLDIEVLARPVIGSSPEEHRVLWYWNPLTEVAEPSPAEFHLLGTGARFVTLHPDAQQSLEPFTLADPVAGHTGFHNHTLMLYGLDNDLEAPAGVYGFFARFTSNLYANSDPFLLIFNYFSDNELLPVASLALLEAATLDGDFDLDDDVDGRDLLEWQRLFGSTTRTVADATLDGVVGGSDLAIWQQKYGTVFGAQSFASAQQVPEPSGLVICVACSLSLLQHRSRGHRRPN